MNVYDYVLPIVGGKRGLKATVVQPYVFDRLDVYGTAFAVGRGVFISAGHVVEAVAQDDVVALGFRHKDCSWRLSEVEDCEIVEDRDIAFLRVTHGAVKDMRWHMERLPALSNVGTAGYPYALDLESLTIAVRAFKGHIVQSTVCPMWPVNAPVYELSFQAPAGLSGAPLFTLGRPARVVGLIIRNRATGMLVQSSEERVDDGTVKTTEIWEKLNLGMAIQSGSLGEIRSRILEGTLADHLHNCNLL